MNCYLSNYLKETGLIPLSLEDIKSGMKICFKNDRAFAQKVVDVQEDMITINNGKRVQFEEGEVYRYVE